MPMNHESPSDGRRQERASRSGMNGTGAATATGGRPELEIGPGVLVPDWSAVTSKKAGEALADVLGAGRLEARWSGLDPDGDRIRRAILVEYAATGHAPSLARLAELTGIGSDGVGGLLRDLEGRDIVVMEEGGETITGAYPFTERETGHRVDLGGTALNAMCAIDALGAGAMCGRDTTIHSSCRHCRLPIRIETCNRGAEIASASPEGAVVWSGIRDTRGCSADTICPIMAFFCSDDCLDAWRRTGAGSEGHRLSMEEGLQVGKALFTPLLAGDVATA